MSETIKACPHCGLPGSIIRWNEPTGEFGDDGTVQYRSMDQFRVICQHCVHSNRASAAEAVAGWNKRVVVIDTVDVEWQDTLNRLELLLGGEWETSTEEAFRLVAAARTAILQRLNSAETKEPPSDV